MTSTDQLARDAEASRVQIAATMAELRARLSPQSLKSEAVRAVSNSGPARFATNLKTDAANSAVPMAIIAVSALWAISNKRSGGPRRMDGSLESVVSLGDSLIGAILSGASAVGTGASQLRAKGRDFAKSVDEGRQAATSASQTFRERGRAVGSRLSETAASVAQAARCNSSAIVDRVSKLTGQASQAVDTAAKLASKDPVFIAGVGLAAAGIAAAVFGISRRHDSAVAAGELVTAAATEAGTAPTAPSDWASSSDEVPPNSSGYGRDLIGVSAPAATEPAD